MEIRALTKDDRTAIEAFTCARPGQPWTEDVEEEIRQNLTDQVESGEVSAVGIFDDEGSLRGVAAWRVRVWDGRVDCRGDTVAVAIASQGQGYGRRLKQAMIDAAKAAGATVLISVVHSQNTAMLSLNRKFGARVECKGEEEPACQCWIGLTP